MIIRGFNLMTRRATPDDVDRPIPVTRNSRLTVSALGDFIDIPLDLNMDFVDVVQGCLECWLFTRLSHSEELYFIADS